MVVLLIIIGAVGGLIGGMGMGGGTLLIPLLVIFTDIPQHTAQFINLAAFIPMSIVALIIHFKNRLVELRKAIWIAVPATAVSVASSFLAGKVGENSLSRYFGIFLLVLGIYQLGCLIYARIKKRKTQKEQQKLKITEIYFTK